MRGILAPPTILARFFLHAHPNPADNVVLPDYHLEPNVHRAQQELTLSLQARDRRPS
jgi:hypothetical protein